MSGAPEVSAVVLCYNRLALTQRTVESLLETLPAAAEVILVDNGSTDGTREYLQAVSHPAQGDRRVAHVVLNATNLGHCQGFNVGLRLAKAARVLITDNDYDFAPGWYEECVRVLLGAPKVGIVSPSDNRWPERLTRDPQAALLYHLEPGNVPTCALARAAYFRATGGGLVHETWRYGQTDVRTCERGRQRGWQAAFTEVPWATHLDKESPGPTRDENEAEQRLRVAGGTGHPELDWRFSL